MTLPWFPRPSEFIAWLYELADRERVHPGAVSSPVLTSKQAKPADVIRLADAIRQRKDRLS